MADPDRRMYFLLQRAAHGLRTVADRRCLDAAGVTTAQLAALLVIATAPGCTQRHVAAELGQGESAITAMITRLTGAGLVSKQAHPTEHRAAALRTTAAGERALAAAKPSMDEFNAEIRDVLGPRLDDVAAAVRDLLALAARL
jgi:MarR family transcriptional regulator, organic hydroperoxide resistance regulator